MKLFKSLIIITLCIFLSGCEKSVPSEKKIISDLPDDVTSCSIQNPFTDLMELQEFEVTNLEIDRSQTMDTNYTAYCIIDMKNDFYKYTKYIVCDYKKYDGNVWFLERCREYQHPDFCVLSNPFTEEDVSSYYINNTTCTNIKPEILFTDNAVQSTCTYDKNYKYKTCTYTTYENYCFNGKYWDQTYYDNSKFNTWYVVGSWTLCEPSDYSIFELEINSFDSNTMTATGYCYYEYSGPFLNTEYYKYYLDEAIITENNDGDLLIEFDGKLNVFESFPYNHHIRISDDKAYGLGGEIELSNPNYTSNSSIDSPSIDYSTVENLQSDTVAIPTSFKPSCLTVNGDIHCWKGADWVHEELWGDYHAESFLEYVYSGDELQHTNWYHILESEEQVKNTILMILSTEGECLDYNLSEINVSYNGNILKITESPESVEQHHQNKYDNINYYENLGFDIIYK